MGREAQERQAGLFPCDGALSAQPSLKLVMLLPQCPGTGCMCASLGLACLYVFSPPPSFFEILSKKFYEIIIIYKAFEKVIYTNEHFLQSEKKLCFC